MQYSTNQLRDLSSLFLRNEVTRWFKNDFKSIDIKLERYNLLNCHQGKSYLIALKKIYKILEKNYPNEYIFKNEFINKWLIKELGNSDSVIFNEFRLGRSTADLVMFNGNSKVFEIKTSLDSDYRLSNQLLEYKKIFNEVYIIISNAQLSKYLNIDNEIGIIVHNSDTKEFELIRNSQKNYQLDIDVLMQVLHSKEYIKIVKKYFKQVPEINSFNQFETCKSLILKIPYEELNAIFLDTMKSREKENNFFKKHNSEFNQLCLSLNLSKNQRNNLITALKTNMVS